MDQVESVDFYSLLGVPQDASASQLKKAFQNSIRMTHPDKNPLPGTPPAWLVIQAYKTLSNPEQKQEYDRIKKTKGAHLVRTKWAEKICIKEKRSGEPGEDSEFYVECPQCYGSVDVPTDVLSFSSCQIVCYFCSLAFELEI